MKKEMVRSLLKGRHSQEANPNEAAYFDISRTLVHEAVAAVLRICLSDAFSSSFSQVW